MNREPTEEQAIGQIISGIDRDRNTLALKTINFVYSQLPDWRDDPNRPDEQSEDKLNLQLCKFLGSRARKDFPMVRFDHEEYQVGRRRVDLSASPTESVFIGVKLYTIYDTILVLECKRLPAPSQGRKKEYVTGGIKPKSEEIQSSGGIQRFKLGFHGADLDRAVMIGYIQRRPARHWHQEINAWILELCSGTIADGCVWTDTEKLAQLEEDVPRGTASCRSIHKRIASKSSDKIIIHHLWVTMNTERSQNNN